jgi:hypothetical protein
MYMVCHSHVAENVYTGAGSAAFPYLFKNPMTSPVVRGVTDDWERPL